MYLFLDYIPHAAQYYCQALADQYSFKFVLKRNRTTKLGDFRRHQAHGKYIISVNKNLNRFQFLLTFIHELAHLKVAVSHPGSTKAHGKEWKTAFRDLLQPLLTKDVFPEPLLLVLKNHMRNPKAAAGSDPVLWNALKVYDDKSAGKALNSLIDGSVFIFRKKQFTKIKKRRTRILCKERKSGRFYLIPGIAEVEVL
jgi:hypothetical protein